MATVRFYARLASLFVINDLGQEMPSAAPRISATMLRALDVVPTRGNLLEPIGLPANHLGKRFEVGDSLRPVVGALDLDVWGDVAHPDALSLHAFPL